MNEANISVNGAKKERDKLRVSAMNISQRGAVQYKIIMSWGPTDKMTTILHSHHPPGTLGQKRWRGGRRRWAGGVGVWQRSGRSGGGNSAAAEWGGWQSDLSGPPPPPPSSPHAGSMRLAEARQVSVR